MDYLNRIANNPEQNKSGRVSDRFCSEEALTLDKKTLDRLNVYFLAWGMLWKLLYGAGEIYCGEGVRASRVDM